MSIALEEAKASLPESFRTEVNLDKIPTVEKHTSRDVLYCGYGHIENIDGFALRTSSEGEDILKVTSCQREINLVYVHDTQTGLVYKVFKIVPEDKLIIAEVIGSMPKSTQFTTARSCVSYVL